MDGEAPVLSPQKKVPRFRGVISWVVFCVLLWGGHHWWNSPRARNVLTSPRVAKIQHFDETLLQEIDACWKRLEIAMAGQDVERSTTPATLAQVEELENALGYRLPGELKASLLVHNGGIQICSDELYSVDEILVNWQMYIEVFGAYKQYPIAPNPRDCDPGWHPGWIPVAGWDAYEIVINLETGEVWHYDDPGVSFVAASWRDWLETAASRFEKVEPPDGHDSVNDWVNDEFPTAGSENPW